MHVNLQLQRIITVKNNQYQEGIPETYIQFSANRLIFSSVMLSVSLKNI
jgi:hypothetical protein